MKSARILNGYRLLYIPNSKNAMTSENWEGYVYEHIYIAEKFMKRSLTEDEVVHHLDGNRLNNINSNLIVMLRSQHSKLHKWIDKGAVYNESVHENPVNFGKPDGYCIVCNLTLPTVRHKYCCSEKCDMILRAKMGKLANVSVDTIVKLLETNSMVGVGEIFNVSDTAIRKFCNKHDIDYKAIRSQACKSRESSKKVQRLGCDKIMNNHPITPDSLTGEADGGEIVHGVQKCTQT